MPCAESVRAATPAVGPLREHTRRGMHTGRPLTRKHTTDCTPSGFLHTKLRRGLRKGGAAFAAICGISARA
mgnify:CR=1 FL=1